jgi:serine/threonine protein phosphatase PrpC
LEKLFKAYGSSITSYQKEKNGDHYLIKELPSESILIAIVADGISRLPCDWFASELVCHKFVELFAEFKIKPLKDRIFTSLNLTNKHVLEIKDKCEGLGSTMSLIVWNYCQDEFHYVNIGDSRIFKINKIKIHCITKDDAIKRTKTIITAIGKREVDDSFLINYFGASNMRINIGTDTLKAGELILLATDGFYDARKSTFESRLMELYHSEKLENDFFSIVKLFEFSAKDDMTAIIIKNEKIY